MTLSLKGKTILSSVGSRHIGRTLVIALAKAGAQVAVIGKMMSSQPRLVGTLPQTLSDIESVGGSRLEIQVDVRDHQQVGTAVERCASPFGGLDVLIYNAGVL